MSNSRSTGINCLIGEWEKHSNWGVWVTGYVLVLYTIWENLGETKNFVFDILNFKCDQTQKWRCQQSV